MPNLAEIGFGNGTLFTARNNTIASVDMPFTRFNDGACCLAVILEHNLVSSLTDTVFNSTGFVVPVFYRRARPGELCRCLLMSLGVRHWPLNKCCV